MVNNCRDGQDLLDDDEDKVETKNGRIIFATKLCPNTLKQAPTRSYDSGPLKINQNLILYINLLYREKIFHLMAGETLIQKVGTHNPSIWDFFGNLKRKIRCSK